MPEILYAMCIGWLAPLAAFGLYTLVHYTQPRRPLAPAPAFFVEAARRSPSP